MNRMKAKFIRKIVLQVKSYQFQSIEMIFRHFSFIILLTFNGKTMLNININADEVEKRSITEDIKSVTFEKVEVRADKIWEIDNLSNLK